MPELRLCTLERSASLAALLGRSRQIPITSPMGRSFDRSAIHTPVCMKLPFGMDWVRFGHGESGLFTADRTRVLRAVLNAHVTSFPSGLKVMTASETAMKWSQAICASILVDEFYFLSPHTRSNPRSGRDVPGVPLEPAFRPNLFTADWGLPPKPVRTRSPKPQADAS